MIKQISEDCEISQRLIKIFNLKETCLFLNSLDEEAKIIYRNAMIFTIIYNTTGKDINKCIKLSELILNDFKKREKIQNIANGNNRQY